MLSQLGKFDGTPQSNNTNRVTRVCCFPLPRHIDIDLNDWVDSGHGGALIQGP
jgi:hypothetical protein